MQVVDIKISNKLRNMSFVCSLLVVLVHIWHPRQGTASWWIYELTSFREIAVPYFFFASGYFLAGHIGESNWWHKALVQRVRSLLVPYLIWSVLWVVAVFVCCLVFYDVSYISKWVDFSDLFGWNPFRPPSPEHLWYLRSLMILIVISPLLVKILRWRPLLILGIALLNIFFYRGNTYNTLGYLIDRTLAAGFLFYFLLGMSLRLELIRVKLSVKTPVAIGVAIAIWGVSHVFVATGCLRVAQLALVQMSTLLWLYCFWRLMPSVEWPSGLTSLSFPIYLTHWVFVQLVVNTFFSNATPSALVLKATVALVGSFFVAVLLKKILNGYSKWFFGGR